MHLLVHHDTAPLQNMTQQWCVQADVASMATVLQKTQAQLAEMASLRDVAVARCEEVHMNSQQQVAELQSQMEAAQGQLTTSAAQHDAAMTDAKNRVATLQVAKDAIEVQLHGVEVSKLLMLCVPCRSHEMHHMRLPAISNR